MLLQVSLYFPVDILFVCHSFYLLHVSPIPMFVCSFIDLIFYSSIRLSLLPVFLYNSTFFQFRPLFLCHFRPQFLYLIFYCSIPIFVYSDIRLFLVHIFLYSSNALRFLKFKGSDLCLLITGTILVFCKAGGK